MSNNYKLCPNCNNALDLNVNKCPYCGQQTYWSDLSKWKDWFVKVIENLDKSKNKKQTSGCTMIIIFFIAIQIIGAIFSLIFQVISSLF
jgi:RNA polymerase subunit RPABC4/transcription elongation factor Spt4